ncbi:MAG: acyl-CoA thioesterase [Chitinophagaceae bacterium]|nr:acyl-CoA thioesterase [Chitinophagaceae bacterium]
MQADIFEHAVLVKPEHLDNMQHVNNVVYLQWVQDAAVAHWNARADMAVREKYNWVVLRHEIDYKSPALLNDELVLKTWVYDYQGVRSIRMVQVFRKEDNKLLVAARTVWCLLNSVTGKPVRIDEEIKTVFKPEVY